MLYFSYPVSCFARTKQKFFEVLVLTYFIVYLILWHLLTWSWDLPHFAVFCARLFVCYTYFLSVKQDNVFVNVVASIQYRALADSASDAYYKLSNTRSQIQAYVFDGRHRNLWIISLGLHFLLWSCIKNSILAFDPFFNEYRLLVWHTCLRPL